MIADRPGRDLPVIDVEPSRRGPDRSTDRRLTFLGLAIATTFLAAALASLVLPEAVRLGWWLPTHLVLAGAAGTAVAAMLPFFVAALAIAPPAPATLRTGALLLVAAGVVAAVAGRIHWGGGASPIAAAGALAYAAGMSGVGLAAVLSLRAGGGVRRPATLFAYGVALVDVLVGVTLVGLYLSGDEAVTARWATLRAAHAWLNVLGFLTLVIAGTLVHFVPTVVGSRIRRRRAGGAAVALLAAAAPLAATGYALGAGPPGDLLLGMAVGAAILGAAALTLHGFQALRDRVTWTTDLAWHRFAGRSLLAGPIWLLVAVAIAAVAVVQHGAAGRSWRLDVIAAPLVLGFVVQVVLGALAHLIPAVGPGTPATHAAQRHRLGRLGGVRFPGWNAGVAGLTVGVIASVPALALAGGAVTLAAGAATLGTLLLALATRRGT